MSDGVPKATLDAVRNFIRREGHLFTDKHLRRLARKIYGVDITEDQICRWRHQDKGNKILKLPPGLRPVFGGRKYNHPGNGNTYNFQLISDVCNEILQHFYEKRRKEVEKGDIIFIKTAYLQMQSYRAAYAMKYLQANGIAERWSVCKRGCSVWKIDMWKLKKELKKLEENGK